MREISFTVEARPIPKARARSSQKSGKHYTPKKTVQYEKLVKLCALNEATKQKWKCTTGPVVVRLEVVFDIPESWDLWKKQAALDGILAHTSKPDIDNILKSVKDACEGVIYKNDSQVCGTVLGKRYAREREKAHIQVTFEVADGAPSNLENEKQLQTWIN